MARVTRNKNGLTDQQQAFADNWLADPERNGTKAYQKAYPKASQGTAEVGASRHLNHPKIDAYIQKQLAKLSKKALATAEDVLRDLKLVADMGLGRVPTPKAIIFDDEPIEVEVKETNLSATNRALELLGKNHELFVEKIDHSGSIDTGPELDLSELDQKDRDTIRRILARVIKKS